MISEGGAMRQPSILRPISGFFQRDSQGATTHANDYKDQKNGSQADGYKRDKAMWRGNPLHHLLRLRVRILSGNLINPGDHHFAIPGPPKGNGREEASQKEAKAQHSHQGAHTGALSGSNRERAVPAITGNGPDQVGGKQNEEAERGERYRE